jgi:ZIP family zinc transporter
MHFNELHHVVQALLATLFTWALTAVGAGAVFFFKTINRKLLDGMLGFAAGVMIAVSYWSLLAPAITISRHQGLPAWLPSTVGFLLGALVLRLVDKLLPHLHLEFPEQAAEGPKTNWHRTILLVFAIMIHNIPEGLAVGVAFGALSLGLPDNGLTGALVLALGIGLQNLPEGMAVSVPLRCSGMSRLKSFWYGQLSGIVEPLAAVLGAALVVFIEPLLPYALAFAAGAMIFVVVEEVIPESQLAGNTDIATMGTIGGFLLMMIFELSFG